MGSRIKENPECTFEIYFEVSYPGTPGSKPVVQRKFPVDYTDKETLQTVPKFCFPFNMDSLTVNQVGQNFTFVLTDIESKQRFGFCRLSSGAHTCYCILSYLPWFEVFYKLLNIIADYTIKGQESPLQELLVSLHTLPIPEPGVPVHLGMHSFFTVPDIRELPSIPENRNLTEYFVAVDVNNMLHLYASMLYERRILICCSKLSTLTACIHGSAAMLYPMHWQHVYIPVLPQHLLDYCCAPMPYLIGVHSSLMEKVRAMSLDDVVLLNVDSNTLESPYEDLQSLPNDVVSSLKSRLRKVSTTTGDGVARAFLKSQAALFGSYRNALQIDPVSECSTAVSILSHLMKKHFLKSTHTFLLFNFNLCMQFIDGRLDLLNSGEGFNDIFEEEINMGEYAGSDKTYHQWLFTVKKGGGAIINTVRTKANPAMKTVYKFAKDHAKMGIKEVKSRLKQKVWNPALSSEFPSTAQALRREGPLHTWDDRRPITMHFGQTRPPMMLKRPSSNVSLETSVDPLAQPYRSLKEVELLEGDDTGFGTERHTAPSSPVSEKFSNVNLLGDIFGCQDEPDCQHITLAKSLEDLRTPKEADDTQSKFTYQRMDLSIGEHSRTLPGLKLSNPYNKLWSLGQDDATLPIFVPPSSDRPPSVQLPEAPSPSREILSLEQDVPDLTNTSNITVPRPQGRKTPEMGTGLAPPVRPKPAEGRTTPGGQEFRQALSRTSDVDFLKPSRPAGDSLDLISLLDPLSSTSVKDKAENSALSSSKPVLPPKPFPTGLPPFPVQPQISLNPFASSLPLTPPQMHYSPVTSGNPFSAVYRPVPLGPHLHTPQTLPGQYRLPSPGGSTVSPSYGLMHWASPLPPSSASNHSLSNSQKSQDPFGDLLTLVQPSAPAKMKVEDLRRKWETFD
uniref:DENN/MADD domain containing 1A n=1 Tax=Neogobius melanostomus TaxID=47308 RepID=A0A8C6T1N2_9GOBI